MPHWRHHLICRPNIAGGSLCARGTRIPVSVILDTLAEGASIDAVRRSYPALTVAHIRAAMAYAADLAREEQLTPLVQRARKTRRKPARRAG